ncbi:hypothetical protein [Paraburkholderia caledonica]|uniref:hypothetical protein n=1 Tax=Paraburkholderia caledonica TaxID=134536 RepID=UPI000B40306C|nr:hypothetical protein [Paraburkholderia caledonica]
MKLHFTNGITIGSESESEHVLVLGTTREGKSMLVQVEADRLGISYADMEHRLEPTDEQKERARMKQGRTGPSRGRATGCSTRGVLGQH